MKPLPVRAVIFDVDGTLVDSLAAYRVVAERAAAGYGLTISDAVVREALNTTRSFWDLALPPDFPDRTQAMETLRRETVRLWPGVLREHGRVCDEAAHVLATLKGRGAKLGIMTGSRRASLAALERAGLLDVFDAVVTREEVERRKPDPEGLLTCASRLEVAPRDAAYVGDTPLDVQAAHAAGMAAIGVLGGAGTSALLTTAGADRLVASLGQLPQIVTIVHLTRRA
ncbi:MAG TPA: HAD family hydrolase [Vicinamibacterales bacterium]|nr:HAD family hydrolase [Vicinamibacterales bacterium]